MESSKTVKVCGSIIKEESLVQIEHGILKNTSVAEANLPYADYYGEVPKKPEPHSLFLLTRDYYSLEEVLRFAQNIDSCYMERVDVASAMMDFGHHTYPAIRVRNFPDYEHLEMLQTCCIKQGIVFLKHIRLGKRARVKVNKCFVLTELEDGIFFDQREDHKGYIAIPRMVNTEEFMETLVTIRNNHDCKLFDAAQAAMIINSRATDMVRIYAENLSLDLLQCIKRRFCESMYR